MIKSLSTKAYNIEETFNSPVLLRRRLEPYAEHWVQVILYATANGVDYLPALDITYPRPSGYAIIKH